LHGSLNPQLRTYVMPRHPLPSPIGGRSMSKKQLRPHFPFALDQNYYAHIHIDIIDSAKIMMIIM
jgi:hypothetical protein